MKTLLTLITLFFVFECSGQKILKSDTAAMATGYKKSDLYVKNQGLPIAFYTQSEPPIAMYKPNNDTLFILPNDKIHFIKIGERVYKIESPTLTEVKKDSVFLHFRNYENKYLIQYPINH